MTDQPPPRRATIINAVIHLSSEQPLLADLFAMPAATDIGLLCTNLRTMAGQRPVFADEIASTFFFPYHHIRFVEIRPASGVRLLDAPDPGARAPEPEPKDLEIDEDFLRRIRDA